VRTKRTRTPKHGVAVAIEGKNPLEEKPKVEELEAACAQALEEKAVAESDTDEGAQKLLSDDKWLATHLDEVLRSFDVDDGSKTSLTARLRKKYGADGDE
jgi:hypothetical protein